MSQCRSFLGAAMHPDLSRVNVAKSPVTERPPPPMMSPPPPPLMKPKAAGTEVATASFDLCTIEGPLSCSPTKQIPSETEFDDDRSTSGSVGLSRASGGESASDNESGAGHCAHPVVSRETFLFHRSLCLPKGSAPVSAKGLHTVLDDKLGSVVRGATAGFAPPPGLAAPARKCPRPNVAPPPGLERMDAAPPPSYSPATFRKERMSILKELSADRNVARAVRRVRAQGVPRERQAQELADIVTFTMEEPKGPARRLYVAFVAGLSAAFEKEECVAGFKLFFDDVYPELQNEVQKLAKLVNIELVATLRGVFTNEEMRVFMPEEFRL